jgi:hypothetical protein
MSSMQPYLYVFLIEALKASDKKDHLCVDVSGEVKGDTLEVASVKLL